MSTAEYASASATAMSNAWAEYEAEKHRLAYREFDPPRAVFVDDRLVVAVTDLPREEFVTCFHEHFNKTHGTDPGPEASIGQRRLRYRQQLEWDERGNMVRNVRRIRGV